MIAAHFAPVIGYAPHAVQVIFGVLGAVAFKMVS